MSSILKALRRLEEERARKSSVAPEIAASLLRRGARRRQLPLWVWPAVITLVAVIVGLFLWSLRPAPIAPLQTLAPPSAPATLPGKGAEPGGGVIIEEVIDQRRPLLLLPPSRVIAPAALLPAPAPLSPPAAKVEGTPAVVTIKDVVTPIAERQSPKVSAIAWQEESSARMAVVDGLPVMTGEMIGTAKVQEILPDHILFLEEGVLFSVRLDSQ